MTHTRSGRTIKAPERYGYDEEKNITIYFKTLTGKTHKITINKNNKIGDLCDKYIMNIHNITLWTRFVFIYNNNRLNIVENIFKSIKTCLSHNDIIHVVENIGAPELKERSMLHSFIKWKEAELKEVKREGSRESFLAYENKMKKIREKEEKTISFGEAWRKYVKTKLVDGDWNSIKISEYRGPKIMDAIQIGSLENGYWTRKPCWGMVH